QRVYECKRREGLKFHNGDAFTAEDVKFSFQRTKGTKILKEKVREITVVDPVRVRFQLHEPFPDFMAFYGTLTTGAGWIVPKKYIERVGDEGFKKQPIGLGPDRRVRLAANYALDRRAMSEMETLGASKPTGSIVPRAFEFALPIEPSPYDPARAKQLLAEAGYPNGFDAGELHVTPPFSSRGEAVMNYLGALGIKLKMRPMER